MAIEAPKRKQVWYTLFDLGVVIFLIGAPVYFAYRIAGFFQIESGLKYLFTAVLGLPIGFSFVNMFIDDHSWNLKKFKLRRDYRSINWKSEEFDKFLGRELLELYQDSCDLFEYINKSEFPIMSDYSFMLLPIAKVYEGALKKVLIAIGLTKLADWEFNPNLSVSKYFNPVGDNKIFEALEDKARDKTVPHIIYSTYQECRNKIFHYDLYRDDRIKTIEDAEFYKKRIEYAIEKAYETFVKK
jgi:hypothetical protein